MISITNLSCGALGGSEASEENQGLAAKVRECGALDPIAVISTPPAPGTLAALIAAYQFDPVSTYQKLRFHVRKNHDGMLRRIVDRHGSTPLSEIKARTLLGWHAERSAGGKLAVAHSFIGQIRTIAGFGFTMMEDAECQRIGMILHKMRFPAPKARTERLTADQAIAIRVMAHEFGWHSIALAQALQFELMLRQKDVIGEWVPLSEPGDSDVEDDGQKWLRGLRWDEIDDNLVLRHVTSKRQKEIEVALGIVFYNGITNAYILTIEGLCAQVLDDKKLSVTCKTGPGAYKKHFLGLSDNVTFFSEQIDPAPVGTYRYRVIFKPLSIVPDIEVK